MKKNFLIIMMLLVYTTININTAIAQCNNGTSIGTNTINTDLTIGTGGGVFNDNGQDITINTGATLTIYRCTFIMSANSKIIVKKGGKLKLETCHIYSCTNMWQGIEVAAGGIIDISSGGVYASVIEDARVAIKYTFPIGIDIGPLITMKLMTVDNVIFNRNEIGINLIGTTDIVSTSPYIDFINSAFDIGNCIFTCRSLPQVDATNAAGYGSSGISNPFISVSNLKVSTASSSTIFPNTPNVYTQPYINNTNFPDNTTGAFLKQPFALNTAKSKTGIVVNSFFGGASGITIGDVNGSSTNDRLTLFDNQDIGISTLNSQIKVQNCSFQKPNLESTTGTNASTKGYGIYIENPWESEYFGGNQIGSDYGFKRNAFFDLNTAIYFVGQGSFANIFNNDIRSTQSLANTSNYKGQWGIRIDAGDNGFENLDITANYLYNIKNAIIFSSMGTSSIRITNLLIQQHTIGSNISPSNKQSNSYVQNAIRVTSNQITAFSASFNTSVFIQNNQLKDVFNGIFASGWINKAIEATGNNITMATDPNNAVAYGIRFEGGVGIANTGTTTYTNAIINNTVTGSTLTKEQSGTSVAGQTFTNVGCNIVTNARYGYRMVGNSNPTQFWDNTISPTNLYGFALTDGGVIGKIGLQVCKTRSGITSCVTKCTSDNDWLVPNTSMPTGHFKTYTSGTVAAPTNPVNSPFIVNNSFPRNNPMGSGTSNLFSAVYSTANNSIIFDISTGICDRCVPPPPNAPIGNSGESPMTIDAPGLEDIAEGELDLDNTNTALDPDAQLLAMQQQLYDALQNPNPELGINQTLQDFVTQNNWGSFQYIYFTRKFLAEGNLVYAQALLNSWYGNTTLDQNYYNYFNWLLQMRVTPSYTPPIENVLAMANLCPATAGNVVYAAQNLYNTLIGDIVYFSDECSSTSGAAARGIKKSSKKKEVVMSNINVYPNPSKGEINIDFNKADAGLKQFTITDMYGKIVWQQQSSFSSGILKANLNVANGIYFLNINNNKNNTKYVQKIVINK